LSHEKYACCWFFETPRVKSWLSNPDVGSEILYITARAGCGKTTIVAHTIQHIKGSLKDLQVGQTSKSISGPFLLYFFFQKRSLDEEGTAIAAMKAMISQLLHQMPHCCSLLLRQYQLLSTKESFSWTLEHLWGVFSAILETISGRPFIFIVLDGLDECASSSRYSLLKRLRSLIKHLDSQDPGSAPYILKVMISGRPDEQLSEFVPSTKHFEITIANTASDMKILIESRISQFATRRSLDPQIAQKLSLFLNQRAQGMFLWVVLVMEELDRRDVRLSDDVIATRLQKVPQTLFSQYEAILKNSPSSRQADLWRILRWILNARRGLSLEELEAALCVELGISKWHDLKGDINYLCGSIIRLDDDTVSFIHQTFRDFLYNYIPGSIPDLTGGINMGAYESETHLARTCLRFLGTTNHLDELDRLLDQGRLPRNRDVELYMKTNPFLSYAAEFWSSHLQTADSFMQQMQPIYSLVIDIFKSSLNRDLLMRLDYFLRHSKHPWSCRCGSKLHLAAYFKLPLLVEYYLSAGESVMADAGPHSYPLVWACETGSYECVKKLLNAGANPNLLEHDGWSPLHWAASSGHESVCGLLISNGAKKDIQDVRGYTPRDMAVQMGQYEIAHKHFGGVEGAKIASKNFPSAITTVGWQTWRCVAG
jgi:Cdc6-like AAA superfamily ATPase